MKSSESRPDPLRKILFAISPNCKEASRLQSGALHRSLSLPQRVGLGIHLILCKWCRRYGKNIQFLRDVIEAPSETENRCHSQVLAPEARERLKQKLTNHHKI